MLFVSSLLLGIIFLILAVFHFYWALGGEWGLDSVIPVREAIQEKQVSIPIYASFIVGILLCFCATMFWVKAGFITTFFPEWFSIFYWIVPFIFLLRIIGDFRYVGLFKKVRNTSFSRADNQYFIPLCAVISGLAFLIQYLS